MSWQQLVLSMLVGAVIGYITNWIAIKMLFRPLSARYLLGMRLPFTPGVIPKEQGRLARSIGEAVSEHLLTNSHISRQLLAPEAEEKFLQVIRDRIEAARGRKVKDVLAEAGAGEDTREKWLAWIKEQSIRGMRSEKARQVLAARLAPLAMYLLDSRPAGLLQKEEFAGVKDSVIARLAGRENRRRIRNLFVEKGEQLCTSNYTLGELLPSPLVEGLRSFLDRLGPRLVLMVEDYMDAPETRQLLVKRVEAFFERSLVRRFMGNVLGFMGKEPRQIADNIVEEVASFFAEEENKELLAGKLEATLDQVLEWSLRDLAAWAGEDSVLNTVRELGDYLEEKILTEEVLSAAWSRCGEILDRTEITWAELLEADEEKVRVYLEHIIGKAGEDRELQEKWKGALDSLAAELLEKDAASLGPSLFAGDGRAEEKILELYRGFVDHLLPHLLGMVDLNSLVRRRVDELEVKQVEELVLQIMRRELVAITWLGAFLGAIIGIAMVTLQGLGKL